MPTKSYFLLLIAFVSGLAVTGMEISAVRLLAPYVGSSQFVWTNVIGVVLVALALGYFIGGKVADARPKLEVLLKIIFAAGFLFTVTPWVIHPVFSVISKSLITTQSGSLWLFAGSLLLLLVLFGFPLLLLGMTSPFLIRLAAQSSENIGEISGRVFAISTAGSIAGTFLPTFFLIPFYGTRLTILIFSSLLILLAVLGLGKRYWALLAAYLLLVAALYSQNIPQADATTIYETETPFHYIRVSEESDGTRYLYFDNALGFQSVYFPDTSLTNGMYYDYYSVLPLFFEKRPLRALILGIAGGTIPRQWHEFYGTGVLIDGVEIDPKVVEIANRFFNLKAVPTLTSHIQDGRQYLARTSAEYDIIVVDAYQRQLYIPWTLTTREFWELVTEHLSGNGLVAINVIGGTDSQLVQAIAATMASVLPNVAAVEDEIWYPNTMILGSREPLRSDPSAVPDPLKRYYVHVTEKQKAITHTSGTILTDDRAPIEQLSDLQYWYR